MQAILTRGKVNILTGDVISEMSIKLVTCHEMFKHLGDIKAFLFRMSEEWYSEAVEMVRKGLLPESHVHQKDPLPFNFKFDANIMGDTCSIHLTKFLVSEHHWAVEQIMMFIKKQANK